MGETGAKRERARPMSPEQRRDEILTVARPLFIEHGRACSTKLIAEAAGIAEGTLFRVFGSKDELVEAVLKREFEAEPYVAALRDIDPELSLEERLVIATRALQERFSSIGILLSALGMRRPPREVAVGGWERRRRGEQALADLLEPHAGRFRVPVDEVALVLRLLTFSGSHPHLSPDRTLSPEEIVDVVLHGTLAREDPA